MKQAHPTWNEGQDWSTAIENTADPAGVAGYAIRGAGSGLIQAVGATQTQVVALGGKDNGTLNFGFNELSSDFNRHGSCDVEELRRLGGHLQRDDHERRRQSAHPLAAEFGDRAGAR